MSDIDKELNPLLLEWTMLKNELSAIATSMKPKADREMALRKEIISKLWPDGKEGTNKYVREGWTLKGVIKIDRKVDEASLPSVKEKLREIGVNPDDLTRDVPELQLRAYRALTEEQQRIFDQALIIKPAAPTLELIPPKES